MSDEPNQIQELSLPAVGIELAACRWNSPGLPKFFALHGWLDNAASMEPLARKLTSLHLVTPDFAGHGRSDFRSADSNYDLVKDVADLDAMSAHLQWEEFGLIGHSRGAMVAALFAAAFPERVTHLVLLDGGAPLGMQSSERPARLARAIREQSLFSTRHGSLFDNREQALQARSNGFVKVDFRIAELLAKRSLVEEPEGFRWRADQRLKAVTTSPLESPTVAAFFAAIRCPVLQIIGSDGLIKEREGMGVESTGFGGPVDQIQKFERVVLSGNHYLHIEQVDSVCETINSWLGRMPAQP